MTQEQLDNIAAEIATLLDKYDVCIESAEWGGAWIIWPAKSGKDNWATLEARI